MRSRRLRTLLTLIGIGLSLPSCGGSPTTPSTSKPAPVTLILYQQTYTNVLPGSTVVNFQVVPPVGGTLTANLGWTFSDDGFTPSWFQGACPGCTPMTQTGSPTGPTSGSWSVTAQGGGTYIFFGQANPANPHVEATSLQITLTLN